MGEKAYFNGGNLPFSPMGIQVLVSDGRGRHPPLRIGVVQVPLRKPWRVHARRARKLYFRPG
jgi:hypothetical protein